MAEMLRWEEKAPNDRLSPTRWEGYSVRDLTISKLLALQAERRGDATYLHDLGSDRRYSYAEVEALTNRMANGLLGLGIKPHEHVGVMLDNSADCLFTHFALGKIGAVSVPIGPAQRGAPLAYLLTAGDIVALVAETTCAAAFLEIASDAPNLRLLITRGETGAIKVPLSLVHAGHERLSEGSPKPPGIEVRFNDPAFIMFTSGTTGPSKGNIFVHATAIMWEQGAPRIWGVGPNDIYYICVSTAHAAGLFGAAYLMAAVGGGVALAPRFSASRFLDDVRRSGSTIAMLLGAMMNFVENQPERPDDRDNPLRIISGGPPPKDPVRIMKRFGVLYTQGYGMTDHSSFTKLPLGDKPERLTSVGKVVEPYAVIVVDDDDLELPPGTVGEILVRSRYPWRSSSGYYKRPLESMAARGNDWFHTGDRGYLDQDGYLFFVDRKKDAIRRRGENISAYEVERVVITHPHVAEAAAYPVQSELSEDEVCVSVVAREGQALDLPDLIRFCIKNMPGSMVPRFVHVADQLPKTLTQRVEKYKMRQWAAENRAVLWDRETIEEFKRIKS